MKPFISIVLAIFRLQLLRKLFDHSIYGDIKTRYNAFSKTEGDVFNKIDFAKFLYKKLDLQGFSALWEIGLVSLSEEKALRQPGCGEVHQQVVWRAWPPSRHPGLERQGADSTHEEGGGDMEYQLLWRVLYADFRKIFFRLY